MTILKEIVKNTQAKINERKRQFPIKNIKNQLENIPIIDISFKENLIDKDEAIIAEIKKASPSAGVIDKNFNPIDKAKEYENRGVAALSVLTEEDFFGGCNEYLISVREATSLPILRKDFLVDEYQIYESRLIGANCILLIAAILSDSQIRDFVKISEELNMDYLLEVHDKDELARVEHFDNAIIGVNNRNLKTFEVDLKNSVRLRQAFNHNNVFVAESGIKKQADIDYLKSNGINVFLIGESLMRNEFK